MGVKGDKLSESGVLAADQLVEKLSSLGDISSKKMFGGHGIFHQGKMFGIVDSKGRYYLKADESIQSEFIEKGADKHGKMPYYSIPEDILSDHSKLLEWAKMSISANK